MVGASVRWLAISGAISAAWQVLSRASMRTNTPRATPAVRAPAPSRPPLAEVAPPLLRAPVSIITPASEEELRAGTLVVGRLPECDIVIDDRLVSRMHARVTVQGEEVVVEDLHSTNGVYVNGLRIARSLPLREGDRLLLGTTEISLFEARPDARVQRLRPRRGELGSSPAPARREAAPTTLPAKPGDSFGKLRLYLDEADSAHEAGPPSSKPAESRSLQGHDSAAPSTARADALEVIGALADRLAAHGNIDEAGRILSTHLKRILQGATAGLTVPVGVCQLASRHALSLARWTSRSTWIDYVVELHLAAHLVMNSDTLESFESVVLSIGDFDRQLFGYYVDGLVAEQSRLTDPEQRVVRRLQALAKK